MPVLGLSKKDILAYTLFRSGLLALVSRPQRTGLVILAYHRLRPEAAGTEMLFDEGVLGPTQSVFDLQVKWLKENFDIISERDILEAVRRRTYKSRLAAVTFDDGYYDNYTLALPVLVRHRVPGIFFVCPELIDSRRLGWWDIIAYLVKAAKKPYGIIRGKTLHLGELGAGTVRMLQNRMKVDSSTETSTLIGELSEACDVPIPPAELQSSQLMTWEQIRDASESGASIGSHTNTHPVLATVDEERQRSEMQESKMILESRLGLRVRTIAYPAGCYGFFSPASMRIARECGYEGAFSYRTGANSQANSSLYNIRRIAPPSEVDARFACSLFLPRLFSRSANKAPSEIAAAELL
jgi:peptidoglycan/xylan/chitin deacetylase (PgdA/CDA1 family)